MTVVALPPETETRSVVGIRLAMVATDPQAHRIAASWRDVGGRRIAWRQVEQPYSDYRVADEAAVWAEAGADLLIVSGVASRTLAVAARDAGLRINQVVVCRDSTQASDLIVRETASGDGVVLSGCRPEQLDQLSAEIASRWGGALSADANPWNMPVAA